MIGSLSSTSCRYKSTNVSKYMRIFVILTVLNLPISNLSAQSTNDIKSSPEDGTSNNDFWSKIPCKDGLVNCNRSEEKKLPIHEGFELEFLQTSGLLIYTQKKKPLPLNGIVKVWTLIDYTYSNDNNIKTTTLYSIECHSGKYSRLQQEQIKKFSPTVTLGPEGKSYFIPPGSFEEKIKNKYCK